MKINEKIAKAYLDGEDITRYSDEWYYTASNIASDIGKIIFTMPKKEPELYEKVHTVYDTIIAEAADFSPINLPIWEALFPDFREVLQDISVDLIVGFPEPYDATVEYDNNGICHIIFDLCCFAKYVGQCDLSNLVRNLMTHELCHVLIHKHTPDIVEALTSDDYITALDAIAFDEGLAHLVSYGGEEIDNINWELSTLKEIKARNIKRMRQALTETDNEKQQKNLYDAICGNYYDKFACMCGMLYLADLYLKGGIAEIAKAFKEGYRGFAEKTICE